MSFGSNGVDWVRSLRKILTQLHGMNFCTTSASFAPSFVRQPNGPKCIQRHQFGPFCTMFCNATERSQMHQNSMKHYETWVLGPMGWIGCVRCEKSRCGFVARTFSLIAPVHPVLRRVSCSYETIPNAPKHYEMHQNMSLGSNGVDQVRSLQKITTWLRGMNFCINCASSPCFTPSFMQLRNDPKCTQTLSNAPKHEFRVQWGGSCAFVAKNYNVTSWDELLY